MTPKFTPDGKVDRDAMRINPTGEYADALDECVVALRFYAKAIHWMGVTEDATPKLLIANGDTDETDGPAVARDTLRKIGAEP